MDNPGFDEDGSSKLESGKDLEAKIHNEPETEKEDGVPESYRYSAEKKALEALEPDTTSVNIARVPADKPYAGMGTEDLLRFSQTPFWNRFRMACTIIFWLAWLGLLIAVIVLTITFPQCKPPPSKSWYETATFYQIYVRSFYDNDGDGIGDINGIRSKLNYLTSIDADAIILSSIYESHLDQENGGSGPADYGYEVTNHLAIDVTYGTMEDFDRLLQEAHDLNIKVIMDFIPNYTGSEHEWFISSSADGSSNNPMWNYYVWADCGTSEPNNWRSVYGQPMWADGGDRGLGGGAQCYLHQFLETQPELNLRSAAVQDELEAILRFWLGKGVDGFRVDKAMHLFEDADLRNETIIGQCTDQYDCYNHEYTASQDEIYPLISRWRAVIDEFTSSEGAPRVLLTDAMDTVNRSLMYYGKYGPDGAHLPMNFELTKINNACNGKCVFELIDQWLYGTPSFATADWMTGTQNLARLADVIPQDAWDDWGYQNAVTMLKMTLPGAPIIYYGEEIGMTSVNSSTDVIRDPAGNINGAFSRDPYRSPMQWDNGTNGGFTNESAYNFTDIVDPWLPMGDNTFNISVEAQNGTEFSPFSFYSELSSLRRTSKTFYVGNFHYTMLTDDLLSYYREYEGKDRYLIAVNFGSGPDAATFNIAESHYDVPNEAEVVMTTRADMSLSPGDTADLRSVSLSPGDGVIFTWAYMRPDGKPKNL